MAFAGLERVKQSPSELPRKARHDEGLHPKGWTRLVHQSYQVLGRLPSRADDNRGMPGRASRRSPERLQSGAEFAKEL